MTKFVAFLYLHPLQDWRLPLADKPYVYHLLRALEDTEECRTVLVAAADRPLAQLIKTWNFKKINIQYRFSYDAQLPPGNVAAEELMKAGYASDQPVLLCLGCYPLIRSEDYTAGYLTFQRDVAVSLIAAPTAFYSTRALDRLPTDAAYQISTVARLSDRDLQTTPTLLQLPLHQALQPSESEAVIALEAIMRNRTRSGLSKKATGIRLFLTDVDGTLTDSGMYYSEHGDELKKFNTRDGKGLQLLKESGILVGIITGENRELVRRRADKLGLDYLFLGIADKVPVVQDLLDELGFAWNEVAFIGDDVNDTGLLRQVGLSAVPVDAIAYNRSIADLVCTSKGGEGCVREFAEYILRARRPTV